MRRNNNSLSLSLWVSLFTLLMAPFSSWAEINYLEMKGIQSLFQTQYEHLSPIYGFAYLKTDILPNLRLNGPFGEKIASIPCLEDFANRKDCPQDFRSALLQKLFPSRDGINLTPSRGMANLATKLEPALIGKILGLIAKSPSGEDPLRTQLNETIRKAVSKNVRKETDEFVDIVVNALSESKKRPSIYPKHFVETAFLAYFWTKANQKEEILPLLNGIHETNSKVLVPQYTNLFAQIKDSRYRLEDYLAFKNQFQNGLPSASQIDEIKNDPEKMSFLGYSYSIFDSVLPPLITYGNAAHKSLGKTEGVRKYGLYADCGETSFRNFFNIVLNDPYLHKFNIDFLLTAAQKFHLNLLSTQGKKHEKGLVSYYTHFNDPSDSNNSKAADTFSRWVISDLNNRKYGKNEIDSNSIIYKETQWEDDADRQERQGRFGEAAVCEIKSGVINFLHIFEALLGDETGPSSLGGLRKSLSPHSDPLSVAGKQWSRITEIFSRPGFELDWNVKGQEPGTANAKEIQRNSDITLQFSINKKVAFEWDFRSYHSSVNAAPQREISWKTVAGSRTSIEHPVALAWLFRPEVLSASHLDLLWTQPLKTEETRQTMLRFLADQPSELFGGKLDFDPILIASVKRWTRHIPLANFMPQLYVINFIMSHGVIGSDLQKPFTPLLAEYENAEEIAKTWRTGASVTSAHNGLLGAFKLFIDPKSSPLGPMVRTAIFQGHLNIFSYIVDTNPNALTASYSGKSPIELAAMHCRLDILKLIVERAPETLRFESLQDGGSLIYTAAKNQCWDIVNFLYTKDPNSLSLSADNGRFPAHWAGEHGNLELLEKCPLDTLGAKDEKGDTPAHLAAGKGNLDVLKALYERKVELSAQNRWKETPLILAIQNRNWDVTEYLLRILPQSATLPNNKQEFPVHFLIKQDHAEFLKQFLIRFPEELKRLDPQKRTLANLAAKEDYLNSFSAITALDPKQLTQYDENQTNALTWLVVYGRLSPIKDLFEHHPEVLETPLREGNNVAHLSARHKQWEILLYLIHQGSPLVKAQNELQETPLHIAAEQEGNEVIEAYVKKVPEVFALKDSTGQTPLDLIQTDELRDHISVLLHSQKEK